MGNPGLKQKIINFLDNDTSKFGLTPEEISIGINHSNTAIVKNTLQELASEGIIIQKSYATPDVIRYKIQKPGQDFIGA